MDFFQESFDGKNKYFIYKSSKYLSLQKGFVPLSARRADKKLEEPIQYQKKGASNGIRGRGGQTPGLLLLLDYSNAQKNP